MSGSEISTELIDAYRATNYRVLGQDSFVLNIGQSSKPLQKLYDEHGCQSAAFITAWNPFSQPTDDAENSRLEALLETELSAFQQHCSRAWVWSAPIEWSGLNVSA